MCGTCQRAVRGRARAPPAVPRPRIAPEPCPLPPAQAFGARNYPMLGIVLQRAQLICCLLIAPIGLLFYFIEPVLLALGQHPEIVAISAEYLRILTPGLFLLVVNGELACFLQLQQQQQGGCPVLLGVKLCRWLGLQCCAPLERLQLWLGLAAAM